MKNSGAVFFDRDGVLIVTDVIDGVPTAINEAQTIHFVTGAIELCDRLNECGVLAFMVTNQPDISRNKVSFEEVDAVNQFVASRCHLTAVAMCTHDNADECHCRKPKPGMLHDLAQRFDVDLSESVMVGDRWRDVDAGNHAGCHTIFIDYNYGENLRSEPSHIASSMAEVGLLLESYFDLTES